MGDIHQLGVVPDAMPKPNEDIITALRIALRDAKSGRMQAIALACVIYDPTSCENKQSTENTYLYTIGYEYAVRVAHMNLGFRMTRSVDEHAITTTEPSLTDEDE